MNNEDDLLIKPIKSNNRKIIITEDSNDINECSQCKNFDEYEREQELLIIFKHSNILYRD